MIQDTPHGDRPAIYEMLTARYEAKGEAAWAPDLIAPGAAAGRPEGRWLLWYRQPAADWTAALPTGNGFVGAMAFGGAARERIQFNEHTIWTGEPRSYARPGAVAHLPEIRRLLQESRLVERQARALDPELVRPAARDLASRARALQQQAEALAEREFMSVPLRQEAYQPAGDLWLAVPGATTVTGYRRWLDLETATTVCEFTADGVGYRREVFCSYPDRLLVVRLVVDQPGRLTCGLALSSPHHESAATATAERLTLTGAVAGGGVRFQAVAAVEHRGGQVTVDGDRWVVSGADELVVRLTVGSNVASYRELTRDPAAACEAVLQQAAAKDHAALLAAHLADHQAHFGRVDLDLGETPAAAAPTDERIAAFHAGGDPQLAALVVQYGRYLLLGCSRPGGQPANLQGIWNASLQPPWDSKYTCNINTQMNYWPALPGNLPECHEALFTALDELMESGRVTAREHYGAAGWVLHHNFDLWRGTAPINAANHGIWVTGGAWLCEHLWEHFLFTGDQAFLAARAYPLMREAAIFFLDYLVEDPLTGWLLSGPSNSPEHGGLVMGPAMDHQIIRALLDHTAAAARLLDRDAALVTRWEQARDRLAPDLIGRHGQLQEWVEDRDDPTNTHRHVSHLWAVYPGDAINWTEERLFAAAQQSLRFRGDAATGWSMGWKVNLWARFLDGDHAYLILSNLLQPIGAVKGQGGMYANLFDAHPPFQIDGNFGAAAGVLEMLLQSHLLSADGHRLIHLLPALPSVWPEGRASGLRARGRFTVALRWREGRLLAASLLPEVSGPVAVKVADGPVRTFAAVAGEPLVISE